MGPLAKANLPPPQPSQFQLALALAIAKSKPPGLSIRDYLHKIRTHILDGSRAENYGSSDEYLDAAAYWHDMFKDSQVEIHDLQTKMAELERVNERLKAATATTGVAVAQTGSAAKTSSAFAGAQALPPGLKDVTAAKKGSKRKQDEVKVSASARPTKKVATKNDQQPTPLLVNDNLIDDFGLFDVPGAGSTTVLHLYRAHKLYQKIEPDPSDLAHHLTQAASNLANHVSTIAKQIQKHMLNATAMQDKRLRAQLVAIAVSKTDNEFPRILRAAGRSFMSLFHGLTTIWEKGTEAAKRHHGATTYTYIQAFNTFLDAISSNCMLVAQLNAQQAANESSSSATTAPKAEQTKAQKLKPTSKARIAQELVSLLLALLTHLIPARQGAHTALFEGFLYLLLERTGNRLYLLIFNRERGSTIEEEMEESSPPPTAQLDTLNTIERHAVSLELKFLVNLLERAMALAPSFLGSLSGSEAPAKPNRAGVSTKQAVKFTGIPKGTAALSLSAKEKLQRTLVECMFGPAQTNKENENSDTEDEDAGNNEFIELLRKPMFVGLLPQPPKIEEVEMPEWFTGEVWRLVGWDVLGWEGDW